MDRRVRNLLQTAVVGCLLIVMVGRSGAGAPVPARVDPEEVLVDAVGHVVVVRILEHGWWVDGRDDAGLATTVVARAFLLVASRAGS